MFRTIGAGALVAALLAWSAPAHAQQIILTDSSIIGSTGSFTFGSQNGRPGLFPVTRIVDSQTGTVSQVTGTGNFWLNGDADMSAAYITLDLGAQYALGAFQLFNSSGLYSDRGTRDFEIFGSNTIQADGTNGATLGADRAKLVGGTLTQFTAAQGVISPDVFETAGSSPVRYIQFRPTSNYGAYTRGYGLNELRVFEYVAPPPAVPEPATWAMMIGGFGAVGGAMRRRGARVTFA